MLIFKRKKIEIEKTKAQQAIDALKTQFGIVPTAPSSEEHLQWQLELYDYILVYNNIVNERLQSKNWYTFQQGREWTCFGSLTRDQSVRLYYSLFGKEKARNNYEYYVRNEGRSPDAVNERMARAILDQYLESNITAQLFNYRYPDWFDIWGQDAVNVTQILNRALVV